MLFNEIFTNFSHKKLNAPSVVLIILENLGRRWSWRDMHHKPSSPICFMRGRL